MRKVLWVLPFILMKGGCLESHHRNRQEDEQDVARN